MKAIRLILAVVAGFVTWFVVVTAGNLAIRAAIPGYVEVERAMAFTLPMLFARLADGALSSIIAGIACAAAQGPARRAPAVLAIVLVLFFIPVHISLWDKFPLWYHATFLVSLALLVMLGAWIFSRLRNRQRA